MSHLDEEILKNLKCVKCNFLLSVPPIFLLHDNTSVCGRCEITDEERKSALRDKPYEEVAKIVLFPCKYQHEGCTEKISFEEVKLHEESCLYVELDCPLNEDEMNCKWIGKRDELVQHCRHKHAEQIFVNPYKSKSELQSKSFLITAYGFAFIIFLKFDIIADILFHHVCLIGNFKITENFTYILKIENEENIKKNSSPVQCLIRSVSKLKMKKLKEFFENLSDIYFSIRIISTKPIVSRLCSCCKNTTESIEINSTSDTVHCDTCNKLPNSHEEDKYPCPNTYNGCNFITKDEYNLRKHYRWLCKYKSFICCETYNKMSWFQHYDDSDKHKFKVLENNCITYQSINNWSEEIHFKYCGTSFYGRYRLSEYYLLITIVSDLLPSETEKFKLRLQISKINVSHFDDILFIDFENISRIPKANNQLINDWRATVIFSDTNVAAFTLKKHKFQIFIDEVDLSHLK